MLFEIGFGMVVGSCVSFFSSLKFHSSFNLGKTFLGACKTLNLAITYGDELALPSVNQPIAFDWGTRLIVGLPVGLSSEKVIDQKRALAEAMRVDADCVEMAYGNDGLVIDIVTMKMPARVAYKDVPTSSHPYRVQLGVNKRGEWRYYDFDGAYPHLLVGGISGGGKSVMLNNILAQLISGPAPDLFLADLKEGIELSVYKELECVKGFASTLAGLNTMFDAVEIEMKRRYADMLARGLRKWDGKKAVFVWDELADMKVGKNDAEAGIKAQIRLKLIRLSAKGRAAGVLLVLCTQRPSADVVDGLIKTNVASSICFRTLNGTQSRIILDNEAAADLPEVPGRFIFQQSRDEILQAPYISDKELMRIIEGLPKKSVHMVAIEEATHHDVNDKPHTGEGDPLDSHTAIL